MYRVEPGRYGAAMPGYWIVRGTVKDREGFDVYARRWLPIAEAHGARYLTAGGRHETREGVDFDRVVIVEFPSYDAALDCYDSPEYQALLDDALKAYDREVTIVDVDGKFEPPS
jgi:uncharacterized protein (DUF1330 family)